VVGGFLALLNDGIELIESVELLTHEGGLPFNDFLMVANELLGVQDVITGPLCVTFQSIRFLHPLLRPLADESDLLQLLALHDGLLPLQRHGRHGRVVAVLFSQALGIPNAA